MKIFQIESKIIKWAQSNDSLAGHLQESDKPRLALTPNHSVLKNVLQVYNNIYITNIETDFILDIDINTGVSFEVNTDIVAPSDLYEIYLKAKESEEDVISKSTELRNIWFRLWATGTRMPYSRPYDFMESQLREVIRIGYLHR